MSDERVSDEILTIPNVVSFIRLAAVPLFCWLVLGPGDIGSATILYAVIATTDWVDGFLARRLRQVSKLGKALDPVADRLLIGAAVIVGLIADVVPDIIGYVLIARELYMALITVWLMMRRGGTLEVRWLGKLATSLVYSAVGWFYVAEIPFLETYVRPLAWVVGTVGLTLYWITVVQYTGDARRVLGELESSFSAEET